MDSVEAERRRTLAAIARQRSDLPSLSHSEEALRAASCSGLRTLASSIRAAAWDDVSVSADELVRDTGYDPGWAPSASVRVAALLDHLSELAPNLGTEPATLPPPATRPAPAKSAASGDWRRLTLPEFRDVLGLLEGRNVAAFDSDSNLIAQATSWKGEIVELTDIASQPERLAALKVEIAAAEKSKKETLGLKIARTESRPPTWADACARAGYARAHFGPSVTANLFARHVAGELRVEVTPDVNTIVNGAVHQLTRLAPRRVDFARSAVTDLEIQRLADHDRLTWRKACRTIEALPRVGPIWRTHGLPDATAMLVARADQGGKKAPGADALLARNFEEARLLAHGLRQVLLTADNGLARTLAARQPPDSVWLAYVDKPSPSHRFVSPMLCWPVGDNASDSSYSCLADLLDEALVCGVDEQLLVTDGLVTLEIRSYVAGDHQYVSDWGAPHLFVRGIPEGLSQLQTPRPVAKVWPMRPLNVPTTNLASGARVTPEQAALALNAAAQSKTQNLRREELGPRPHAQNDMWNFLKAIGVIDGNGGPGHARPLLENAISSRDFEQIRELMLTFEPVARVVREVGTKFETDNRTVAAALGLAAAAGLISRSGDRVLRGNASPTREHVAVWLRNLLAKGAMAMAEIAESAATQLDLSPVRFEAALASIVDDPDWQGSRGGSTDRNGLDTDVLRFASDGTIVVEELRVDGLLGLRSLARRT